MATAADLMTPDIPRSDRHRTVGETIAVLRGHTMGRSGHVYPVDDQAALIGQVRVMANLLPLGLVPTIRQDILSVGIYLIIATALLPQ
jgi:hypothetical protein